MMKKVLIFLLMLNLLFVPHMFAETTAIYNKDKAISYDGFSIHVLDQDIDTTNELVTELVNTYAQLAAEDQVDLASASSADITQTVTIIGIDDSGNRKTETITLTGIETATSTNTFRYIDNVSLSAECAGLVEISRETGTFITSIPAGSMETGMAQHFNGENDSYITGWWANAITTTGNLHFELRWYSDDADCLDATDGYIVLDEIFINAAATSPYNPAPHVFPQPIKCPAGGWLAVYARGSAVNSDGTVTIQGIDF